MKLLYSCIVFSIDCLNRCWVLIGPNEFCRIRQHFSLLHGPSLWPFFAFAHSQESHTVVSLLTTPRLREDHGWTLNFHTSRHHWLDIILTLGIQVFYIWLFFHTDRQTLSATSNLHTLRASREYSIPHAPSGFFRQCHGVDCSSILTVTAANFQLVSKWVSPLLYVFLTRRDNRYLCPEEKC